MDETKGSKILAAAGALNLPEALESLITTSRTSDGRLNLGTLGVVEETLHLIPTVKTCDRLVGILCLKLLRNLCAGNSANQECFIRLNGVVIVCQIITAEEHERDPEIVRTGLQVLANVSHAGEMPKRAVWPEIFSHGVLVLRRLRMKKICDPLCRILFSCIDGIPGLLEELQNDLKFYELLTEIFRIVSSVELEEDWLKHLLLKLCLDHCHFDRLFSSTRSFSEPSIGQFSSEQSCLLRLVSEILNDRLPEITVKVEFALFVLEIFKASYALHDSISASKSRLPTGQPDVDVLGYCLRIMRYICAAQDISASFNGDRVDVVEIMLANGLVASLLSLLRHLEPPSTIRKAMKQSEDGDEGELRLKVCPYRGFRCDVVAIIANCCYGRQEVQDEIRNKNGILLLLQQCVTDEDNPYLREWGIWCLRNLLEKNEENQKIVAELELQSSIDVPELAGLNLKVEIDELTRRAKLVNIPA